MLHPENVSNHPPIGLQLSNVAVAEGALPWALVGSLTTLAADVGDRFTYCLTADAQRLDKAAFRIVNDRLVAHERFDFETKSSFRVRVRTTDSNGLSWESEFGIQVTEVVLAGDANGDDRVDIFDSVTLRRQFGKSEATQLMGDFNGDGRVAINDFVFLRINFGMRI